MPKKGGDDRKDIEYIRHKRKEILYMSKMSFFRAEKFVLDILEAIILYIQGKKNPICLKLVGSK